MKTEIVPKSNTPKTKRGEDRQKKLLNTAIKVFLEHGYEGASLEKIILDAGGSRSTIYSLYGSKKGLFLACLKSLVEEVYFATQNITTSLVLGKRSSLFSEESS